MSKARNLSAYSLDFVCSGLASGKHGRCGRLHGYRLDGGIVFLESGCCAGDGSSRADTYHEDVHLSVGVFPDLLCRGANVRRRIGGVLKLLEDDGARGIIPQFA